MTVLAAGATPAYLPQLTALIVGAALVAYFGFRARLVPIVAFLLTGVVIGPNQLGLVRDIEVVEAAAEVGVLLLLFTIGLEFSLERLRELRRPLFLGGGLQVGLTTALTTGVLVVAGVDVRAALFTGLLVSLSSTAIVLKLLADRGRLNAPEGRQAVSVLLFQDLAVVAMVLLVPALGESGGSIPEVGGALAMAAGLIVAVVVLARRVLPPILERVASTCSPEIFLLAVMAICIGTAYGTSLAGVSVSLGAFLAGLVVSESRFKSQAMGEVLPLQILFSATFFVSVGMLLDLGFVLDNMPLVLAAVAGVLVIKALTGAAAVRALGESPAVAIAAGLTLAQLGEFSFVLASSGATEGLTPAGLGADGTQAFIAATVILMAATPWLAGVGTRLGSRMGERRAAADAAGAPPLGRLDPVPGAPVAATMEGHVVVAGYGHWARGVTQALQEADVPQVVVTLSPDGAAEAHERGLPVILGDPGRLGTLTEAGAGRARVVLVPDDGVERTRQIVRVARTLTTDAQVVVRARHHDDAPGLEEDGASFVIVEEAETAATLATKVMKQYGMDLEEAVRRAHGIRRFYREGARAPLGPPGSRATVDTEAEVAVELNGAGCEHAPQVHPVVPRTAGCEECLESGDRWVHLRLCLTCGHVGCCDSSPNRHARHHHEGEGHHVVRSAEPGESWVYCFADDRTLLERS